MCEYTYTGTYNNYRPNLRALSTGLYGVLCTLYTHTHTHTHTHSLKVRFLYYYNIMFEYAYSGVYVIDMSMEKSCSVFIYFAASVKHIIMRRM